MEKFTEKFKKFFSSDEALKRIPTYLFTLCVLFIGIFIMLFNINSNLKLIAENSDKTEVITKDEKYDEVLDVFIEEESKVDDFLPYHSEVETKNEPTSDKIEENTTEQQNNPSKIKYVINTNSKKIHFIDCSFVKRTSEENKKTVEMSKNELNNYLNDGYEFCKTCGGK